ncbi:MAG: serine/threonine-protein phosphatase [Phycisphaerales bacterium]|nr:serine/threonine-protein phosphatase [Phycisphaerales bacterium]
MEVWGGNRSINAGITMSGLDAWVFSRPFQSQGSAEAGGGDIHYLSSCMTGRISRMLVADVSGHGAAVDSIAITLRDLMRKYVNFLDQSKFVESLNVQFGSLARAGSFATALVATYWAPTEYLVATNAGHPRPLLYRAARGKWEFLDSSSAGEQPVAVSKTKADADGPANLPLGILEPTSYDQFSVQLREGDLVLIYTDSLVESRGADGKLLGDRGLLALLGRLDTSRPAELVGELVRTIAANQGSDEFNDDVTCLLLRRNGVAPKLGVGDLVKGMSGFVKQAIDRLRGSTKAFPWPEIRLDNIGGVLFKGLNRRWKG